MLDNLLINSLSLYYLSLYYLTNKSIKGLEAEVILTEVERYDSDYRQGFTDSANLLISGNDEKSTDNFASIIRILIRKTE